MPSSGITVFRRLPPFATLSPLPSVPLAPPPPSPFFLRVHILPARFIDACVGDGRSATMAPYLCANCRRSHFSPTGAVMDSASRTCFCSVECAWTLRFRQQTAATMAAPAPAPAGDHYQYHQHHGAYGAGATTRGGGGGGHRSGDEGSTGRGHDNRGAAYADRYPQVRTEEAEREERGAALQQTANLLRSGGVGGGVQVPTGGAVDSESDSSSPSWDGHDSRHHAMFDWQALDKDKPFGTFSDMH